VENADADKTPTDQPADKEEAHIIERELKLLTKDGSPDPFYMGVTPFLFKHKMLVHSSEAQHLITSQRDTPDFKLLQNGTTLRLRGTGEGSDINAIKRSDICMKIPHDKNGGLARKEYEEIQNNFFNTDLDVLRNKYPDRSQHPELHDTLDMIAHEKLEEFFRIDVIRERHIIKIPNELVGLRDDQAFYGELLYDRVRYVIDHEGLGEPIVINPHCELELEPLNKVCAWNHQPGHEKYTCRNLTQQDKIRCLDAFSDMILQDAARGHLFETKSGKAERGFDALTAFAAQLIKNGDQIADHLEDKLSHLFAKISSGAIEEKDIIVIVIVKPEDIENEDRPVALHPRPPS